MADQTAMDDAARDRIIRHMNADHQASLSYYLQHYLSLSPRTAHRPHLRALTFSSMVIQTSDLAYHTIAIIPPLKSWTEARTRTIEMDHEARKALGISSIRITEYEPPKKQVHVIVFGLCFLTGILFATKSWIKPGTLFYDKLLPYFPGGPKTFLWIVETIFVPVIALHALETWYLDSSKLRKYGVERGSALWWKWTASCFIEGWGCHQRIAAAVKRKTLEAEKASH